MISKNFNIHYCGWDKKCQLLDSFTGQKNRRINVILWKYYFFIDVIHWKDRGSRKREVKR